MSTEFSALKLRNFLMKPSQGGGGGGRGPGGGSCSPKKWPCSPKTNLDFLCSLKLPVFPCSPYFQAFVPLFP